MKVPIWGVISWMVQMGETSIKHQMCLARTCRKQLSRIHWWELSAIIKLQAFVWQLIEIRGTSALSWHFSDQLAVKYHVEMLQVEDISSPLLMLGRCTRYSNCLVTKIRRPPHPQLDASHLCVVTRELNNPNWAGVQESYRHKIVEKKECLHLREL